MEPFACAVRKSPGLNTDCDFRLELPEATQPETRGWPPGAIPQRITPTYITSPHRWPWRDRQRRRARGLRLRSRSWQPALTPEEAIELLRRKGEQKLRP